MFISIDRPQIKVYGVLGGTTCFCTAISAVLMKILINNQCKNGIQEIEYHFLLMGNCFDLNVA